MQKEGPVRIWSKTPWEKLFFWKMAKIAQNHHLKFSKIILLPKADYLETKKGFCHKKPNHWPFRRLYAAFSEFFWKIWKNLKSANSLAVVTWAKFYSTHQTRPLVRDWKCYLLRDRDPKIFSRVAAVTRFRSFENSRAAIAIALKSRAIASRVIPRIWSVQKVQFNFQYNSTLAYQINVVPRLPYFF